MSKRNPMLIAAVLLIHLGCSATHALASSADSVVVTVVNAADTTMVLPGVAVSMITASGEVRPVGVTDQFGRVFISKAAMRESSALVVLFCHEIFFCGAIRVAESNLHNYDEYLLAIAPVTVR